jgi:hypothetical protein
LPYNYWSSGQWREAFENLQLRVASCNRELHLYSPPARWLFDRKLHFVALLNRQAVSVVNGSRSSSHGSPY